MINRITESDLILSVKDGRLKVKGSESQVAELLPTIKQWKPELLKIAIGQTVNDVGGCDRCGADLLGLITFDGYVNRVCPACGCWKICFPPRNTTPAPTTTAKPVCIAQLITLF